MYQEKPQEGRNEQLTANITQNSKSWALSSSLRWKKIFPLLLDSLIVLHFITLLVRITFQMWKRYIRPQGLMEASLQYRFFMISNIVNKLSLYFKKEAGFSPSWWQHYLYPPAGQLYKSGWKNGSIFQKYLLLFWVEVLMRHHTTPQFLRPQKREKKKKWCVCVPFKKQMPPIFIRKSYSLPDLVRCGYRGTRLLYTEMG